MKPHPFDPFSLVVGLSLVALGIAGLCRIRRSRRHRAQRDRPHRTAGDCRRDRLHPSPHHLARDAAPNPPSSKDSDDADHRSRRIVQGVSPPSRRQDAGGRRARPVGARRWCVRLSRTERFGQDDDDPLPARSDPTDCRSLPPARCRLPGRSVDRDRPRRRAGRDARRQSGYVGTGNARGARDDRRYRVDRVWTRCSSA